MNKFIVILSVLFLTACGGGGDDPVDNSKYTVHNGTYNCALKDTNYQVAVQAKFERDRATTLISGKTYVYDDLISEFNGFPRYSEKLTGTNYYETIAFAAVGTMLIYVGPADNLGAYVDNMILICSRISTTTF